MRFKQRKNPLNTFVPLDLSWYQKLETETVEHSDANFYGIYGNDVDGWELAYWGEDMEEPWIGNMYYDEECTEPVDIDLIEK